MGDLVARGLPLRIYALRAPRSDRVHADSAALLERVTYRPRPGGLRCLCAHARVLRHSPARYLNLLLRALIESRGCPHRLRDRLVALDAAVGFAGPLRAHATAHLHAHFASVPTTVARYASQLLGIPFSFAAHARDIYVAGRQDPGGLGANLRDAAFVITCTEYNRRHLLANFPDVPPAKIHRVYHGIDPRRFAAAANGRAGEGQGTLQVPARLENAVGTRGQSVQILAVGRLLRKKGLHVLVEACGLLKQRGYEFALVLVGDGPEKRHLTELAVGCQLVDRALFLGALTQEELLPLYAQSHILALPCVMGRGGDRDGLPNVILEALAARLAVVSTPLSGIPEVVEDGVTGLLVPPEDAGALAAALERLITDPELRRRLGEAGCARVCRDFDIRKSPLAALFARETGIEAAPAGPATGAPQ
ncbi:MAG: glycosyltransferase family 4 protein [Armatimonadetes bacterium]|nr:glycosyltransferase family 4 protein [Armatimonadota bacterium]